ncbi:MULTISPECIES: PDZ domain-containing protein [unclassified Pseudactinotalea]|uniref:YlbL family protein n=1 Tax=unclassified Pseudactinotalea TaxID=2649176 RepID=UPI00128D5F00|nr:MULTISPECIES: S16 family serine protease [unclassified Pseudactinotalea]MPV51089.1 signal protein PDZ [Pseudactinotalea sp. HY160]QGH70266.1 signal protein PDZ [Pseudactinotalea sp. HY158]
MAQQQEEQHPMQTRGWREGITPRAVTTVASGAVFLIGLGAMLFSAAPYAVESPGPTIDTLGEYRDVQLITIEGAPTYPVEDPDSQLRLTTVVALGGPGYPVLPAGVLRGWISGHSTVLPREAVYSPEQTREEVAEQGQAQMRRSQEDATVVALTALGYDVPAVLTVTGAVHGTGAQGIVEQGDVLTAITPRGQSTTAIDTYADLADTLAATPPGTPVTLTVERDGVATDLVVMTGDDGYGGSTLGVYLQPEFDLPVQVTVDVEDVGGPSAGTMFTLGIIDRLTPGDLTGGHVVAGTGTISLTGRVGPIGGIVQKLWGAHRDGAEFFLAPVANCAEVVGNVPDGLHVAAVSTAAEARDAVEAIAAGDGRELPGCSR